MTHKKIAKLANVSESTVSKALSGSKEISEELSQKIIKIAIENGYFEGKNKRKIEYSRKDTISIAVVCHEYMSTAYAREITAFKKEVEIRGGLLSVYASDFDNEKMNRIIEMITVRNSADGIILYPCGELKVTPSAATVIITNDPSDKYDTVSNDGDEILYDIIKHLKEAGHTKIAYAGETHTRSKEESFKKAMDVLGIPCDEKYSYVYNARFEDIGYKAAEAIVKEKVRPTAVVCAYDEVAIALIHKLDEKNIRVPEDISVIGINDIPSSAYSSVPLTTVNLFDEEKGATVVAQLYDRICNSERALQHVTVKHKLIERKSVKKIFE